MAELRKFEESTFPRPAPATQPHAARQPRPGAINPPAELRSPDHHPSRPPEAHAPPKPWLSKLALPTVAVRWDPRVIRYLQFYRDDPKGRAIMAAWLRRMGRHRAMILRVLRKHGVPDDLLYVAMVESGFNPLLTSRVGAAGIWQFMSGTGSGYGLHRDYWIDERRNPKLSTAAAARYLKDLHSRFGTWELALAAYNAGYGAVQNSIRKYNTNDYWQICQYESGLPWSTTLYVPKVLAVAIVGRNRGYFGYGDVRPDPPVTYELVSVPVSITLAQAARAAGIDTDTIERLNPELRRGRTPPSSKAWLRVPSVTRDTFYANLARMKGQLAQHRPYLVRLGDTADALAADLAISRATLRRINGIQRDDEIRPGLVILVPAAPKKRRPVKPADGADGKTASEGEEEPRLVAVPQGVPTQVKGRRRVFYRTVLGDSLEQVARHLQVDQVQLAGWNKLELKARLIPDMVLQAFVAPDFDDSRVRLLDPRTIHVMVAGSEEFLNAYEERKGRRRQLYTARPGDTLASVGRRFGLSVGSLARINRFGRNTRLKEGQRIVVYLDPTKVRRRRVKKSRRPAVKAPPSAATSSKKLRR